MLKIKEVSKIFDMPPETLRFIERQGLVHPSRSGDGQYREYDIKAFGELFDYMKLRGIGIPVKEIDACTHSGGLSHLTKRILREEKYLKKEIDRMELVGQYLEEYRRQIEFIQDNPSLIWIERQQAYRYIVTGSSVGGNETYKDQSGLATQWRKYMPFVSLGFQTSSFFTKEEVWKTKWIFIVPEKYAQTLNMPMNDQVGVIEEQNCLCAYARYTGSINAYGCFDFLREEINKRSYKVRENMTAIRLASETEKTGGMQYIQLLVPIEKTYSNYRE